MFFIFTSILSCRSQSCNERVANVSLC